MNDACPEQSLLIIECLMFNFLSFHSWASSPVSPVCASRCQSAWVNLDIRQIFLIFVT